MKHHAVPIFSTRRFSKLMEDYVGEKEELKSYYNRPHKPESYTAQMTERSQFPVNKKVLVEVLESQYANLDISHRYPLVHENILALGQDDTYTVVTGHQLCLFTGPLYFIYKIVNTIRLAEVLSEREHKQVIPVFWMATEDHDFDEVNHIWYGDLKYQWNRDSGDGVGRLTTDGIESVIEEIAHAAGSSKPVSELIDLFRRCYRAGQTLADATRELVTHLFAHRGLVILDADDARLKASMIPIFTSELQDEKSAQVIAESNQYLHDEYFAQVTPRDINLFYLADGMRYRLAFEGDRVITVEGPHSWTQEEVQEELSNHPERFSPNVILRPVYQEVILPNLAYIGGGGELAYWLQLKPVFELYNVPFPILRLRNSAGFLRKSIHHKMDKLELNVEDIVAPLFEQRRAYFRDKLGLNGDLEDIRNQSEILFSRMMRMAERIDPSLEGTAKAYNARQEHLLNNFETKILRAAQRREEDVTRMFQEISNEAFPSGGLQERRENYISLLERFGPGVIDMLLDELDPFAHEFSWFVE